MTENPDAAAVIRPEVRGLGAYSFTPHQAEVVLDQNESPFPLPDYLQRRLRELVTSLEPNRYPDLEPRLLRAALAEHTGWDPEGIAIAGGSNVLIQAAVIAAGAGRTVLTVSPTFSVYSLQARLLAETLREVPLRPDFSLDMDGLERELKAGSGVFFLASPAAPTGNGHPAGQVRRLAEAAGDRWLFVVDEAYHEFAGSDLSPLVADFPGVVVLRTFSKAAGLAGLRLGYALARPVIATQLRKVVMPFSVSALQERAGLLLLENRELTEENVHRTVKERTRVAAALEAVPGLTAFPSDANFILFRVPDATAVHGALLEEGVLIRRQDHLPGLHGCLRVSIGLPAENDRFLEALTVIMNDNGGRR